MREGVRREKGRRKVGNGRRKGKEGVEKKKNDIIMFHIPLRVGM